MMFWGWTTEQWALAVGWYEQIEGIKPLPTVEHAMEIHFEWGRLRVDQPGGSKLVEVVFPMDLGWSYEMLTKAACQFPYITSINEKSTV